MCVVRSAGEFKFMPSGGHEMLWFGWQARFILSSTLLHVVFVHTRYLCVVSDIFGIAGASLACAREKTAAVAAAIADSAICYHYAILSSKSEVGGANNMFFACAGCSVHEGQIEQTYWQKKKKTTHIWLRAVCMLQFVRLPTMNQSEG